jgi:hypothetical protein
MLGSPCCDGLTDWLNCKLAARLTMLPTAAQHHQQQQQQQGLQVLVWNLQLL